MITFSKKHRSVQAEIMDNLDFQGEEMKHLLNDLKKVNKWLGGNSITIDGLKELLKNHSKDKTLTILDIGCGDGELLRKCADFGMKNNFDLNCIGLDFNQNILTIAQNRSRNYPNLTFKKVDVFLEEELVPNCDIALSTLFLHHFNNNQIEGLLKIILKKTEIGVIVNDLQRSKQAFFLFKIVSKLFLKTKTAQHDGLVSIARGFKKNELEAISLKINNQKSKIHWRWAYRYQWILKKTN